MAWVNGGAVPGWLEKQLSGCVERGPGTLSSPWRYRQPSEYSDIAFGVSPQWATRSISKKPVVHHPGCVGANWDSLLSNVPGFVVESPCGCSKRADFKHRSIVARLISRSRALVGSERWISFNRSSTLVISAKNGLSLFEQMRHRFPRSGSGLDNLALIHFLPPYLSVPLAG